jgi:hypothetical protein
MASAVAASELAGGDRVYFNRPGVALVTWNPDLRAVCLESQGWADTSESQAVLDAIIRALRAPPRVAMAPRRPQDEGH